jgi:primary-amine oxidase
MPADVVSFWLKPFGFFDQNPSIDVPPSMTAEGEHCHTGAGSLEHGERGEHSHER